LTVVGPNGAGKSTLLLALAHLLKPARGDIQFDGKSVNQWNDLEYRRKISFVFQAPLLMDMSVEQNVALGLKFRGVPKEETQARVGKWIKAMGRVAFEAQTTNCRGKRRGQSGERRAGA
jgi:tungstate transport system ATP-binding protein